MTVEVTFKDIIVSPVAELVGINDAVAASEYTNSVKIVFPHEVSGEIVSVALYATEDGSGAVQQVTGNVLFLSADPAVSAGDTAISAAEWLTVIGGTAVTSANWAADANGGIGYVVTGIPFTDLSAMYAVMKFDASSAMNDAGGDDEQLELKVRIRRG